MDSARRVEKGKKKRERGSFTRLLIPFFAHTEKGGEKKKRKRRRKSKGFCYKLCQLKMGLRGKKRVEDHKKKR